MKKQESSPLPKIQKTSYSRRVSEKQRVLRSSTQENAESNSSPTRSPFPLQGDYKVDHVVQYFHGDTYTIEFTNDHGLTNRATINEAELKSKCWEKLLEFWAFNACCQNDEAQQEKKYDGKSLSEVCLDKIKKHNIANSKKCITPPSSTSQSTSTFEEVTPPPTSPMASRTRNRKRTPMDEETENFDKKSSLRKQRRVQPPVPEIRDPTPGTSASALSLPQTSQKDAPATSVQETTDGLVLPNELERVKPSVSISVGRVIQRSYIKDEATSGLKKSFTVEWTVQTLETSESLGMEEKTVDSLLKTSTENTNFEKVLKKSTSDGVVEIAVCLRSTAHAETLAPPFQLPAQQFELLEIDSSSSSESESELEEDVSQDERDIEDEPESNATRQLRRRKTVKTQWTKKKSRRTNVKKSDVGTTRRNNEESTSSNPEPEVEPAVEGQPVAEEMEFGVDRVSDYRVSSNGEPEFHIKWKNYDSNWDTWEPLCHLYCDGKLIKFYVERALDRKRADKDLKQKGSQSYFQNNELPPIPPLPLKIVESLGFTEEIETSQLEAVWKEMMEKGIQEKWKKPDLLNAMLEAAKAWERHRTCTIISDINNHKNTLFLIEFKRRRDENLKGLKEWEKKMNSTTQGRPQICVENNIDLASRPEYFSYINDVTIHQKVKPQLDDIFCNCDATDESRCSVEDECSCLKERNLKLAYNSRKRLTAEFVKKTKSAIYECGAECQCGPTCLNRVVQDGLSNIAANKVCIFRTKDKGWGVKTNKKIRKNSYVCLYAGEVITTREAEKRGKKFERQFGSTYLFDLDFYTKSLTNEGQKVECKYTVDASRMGNYSHFINHSCEPNLAVYNVWVGRADKDLPKLAFFAINDIQVGEELTYDYCPGTNHDEGVSQRGRKRANKSIVKATSCLCGSAMCRKIIFY